MSFPDSVLTEVPTPIAAEILGHLHDCPTSVGLQAWMRELRGDVDSALAQSASSLFPKGA